MIPLFDKKSSKKIPYITILLVSINIVLFLVFKNNLIPFYAFIPGDFSIVTLFTHMFLHANIFHLLINVWFLWVFGDAIENRIGHLKFLLFYFLCGVCSALIYFLIGDNLNVPLIGASGAISGILGSYLILFPKNKLKVFPNFTFSSFVYIFLWFSLQLLFIYFGSGSVSYLGHVGGFLSGFILILFFK